MRFLLQVPIVIMLSSLGAKAQESLPPKEQGKIEIGQGVICDTLEQVERYVALRGNGTETAVALQTVNEGSRGASCGVALVMFSAEARIADLTVQGKLLSIIQINVLAFGKGPSWMKIPATIRYTVIAEQGQVV
jgi:hypothetical protein